MEVFDLMDVAIAQELNLDVDTYLQKIELIDCVVLDEIIDLLLSGHTQSAIDLLNK